MTPSRALKTVAALGMLSSAVWASTFASFSDTADATTTFTAGSLDIKVGGADSTAFTSLSAGNLKPGEVVYAPLLVTNTGSLAANVSMATTSVTGTLPVVVTVRRDVTACSSSGFASGAALGTADSTLAASAFAAQTLPATSGSLSLCFKVELPTNTDNTFQKATAAATFRFTGEQV
ncbi:MAG: hypothetical protein JWM64_2250 [Frankiales bacterium]|nr:hypothetical protein [Frankiales bacterium]